MTLRSSCAPGESAHHQGMQERLGVEIQVMVNIDKYATPLRDHSSRLRDAVAQGRVKKGI